MLLPMLSSWNQLSSGPSIWKNCLDCLITKEARICEGWGRSCKSCGLVLVQFGTLVLSHATNYVHLGSKSMGGKELWREQLLALFSQDLLSLSVLARLASFFSVEEAWCLSGAWLVGVLRSIVADSRKMHTNCRSRDGLWTDRLTTGQRSFEQTDEGHQQPL